MQQAELSVQGIVCCRNTVAKLMHRVQIVPKATRHYRVTTDSRNTKEVLPNLVRRCFKAERPNACWLSDVTYIPTREGWLYEAQSTRPRSTWTSSGSTASARA
jgi:putative transposase